MHMQVFVRLCTKSRASGAVVVLVQVSRCQELRPNVGSQQMLTPNAQVQSVQT